jgi:hypothetical protein
MRKSFPPGVIVLILLFMANACAQGLRNEIKVYHPDFSGTWKVDVVKSGFMDGTAEEISDISLTVVVDQKLPVISIKVVLRHLAESGTLEEFNIYTDGRITDYPGSSTQKQSAEWKDNKLIFSSFSYARGHQTLMGVVEFELSGDGNTLFCTQKGTKAGPGPNGETIAVVDNTKIKTLFLERIAASPPKPVSKFDLGEE